jgi:eukaryotic-like serine/threonine-protein kinase
LALASGTRLGPYEILTLLGAGGMGEVYRARDARLGRDVAIKVLPPDVARDADRRARFEREARAVAALSHPNILALYDIGVDHDQLFVVTELLEGHSLAERLAEGAVPFARRWRSR